MKNLINWFEIPATQIERAIEFYGKILDLEIHLADVYGTKMGFLPSDGSNVSGAIVQGESYNPSKDGSLLYLNGGENLQFILDKVESNNGKIIVPKTLISEEMGYFAMFIDTEGNKIALHSIK